MVLQACEIREGDRLHLGVMLKAFSNIGNFFTSVISHSCGKITQFFEVKKVFLASPSSETFRCFSSGRRKARMIYYSLAVSSCPRQGTQTCREKWERLFMCLLLPYVSWNIPSSWRVICYPSASLLGQGVTPKRSEAMPWLSAMCKETDELKGF